MIRTLISIMMMLMLTGCLWRTSEEKQDPKQAEPEFPLPSPSCKEQKNCQDALSNLSVDDLQALHQLVGKSLQHKKTGADRPAKILFGSLILSIELSRRHRDVSPAESESYFTLFNGFFDQEGNFIKDVDIEKLWRTL